MGSPQPGSDVAVVEDAGGGVDELDRRGGRADGGRPTPTAVADVVAGPRHARATRLGVAAHRRGWWANALVVAIYAALAVALFWNIWSTHPATVSPSGADVDLNVWLINWVPHALVHGHNPFFSNYVNYPYGVNLLDNTSEPLLAVLASPVTFLFGPIAAFNVLLTSSFALSATAGYAFARRWVRWRPAAFAGGLLYGFSPYMISAGVDSHLHLTFVALPPLIYLLLHDLLVRQRGSALRRGSLLGLLVTAQFFVSTEVLSTTLAVAVVGIVVLAVAGHRTIRRHLRHAVEGLASAAAVAVALLAYPVWFALAGPGHISGAIQLVPQAYRADLLGPIVPDSILRIAPRGLLATADHFATDTAENGSYLGIPLLLVLAAGTVWLRRRKEVMVAAVIGVAAFVLSLGGALAVHSAPQVLVTGTAKGAVPLPEGVFDRLGFLKNTIPSRFSLYVSLFAALVLAVVIEQLFCIARRRTTSVGDGNQRAPTRRRRAVVPAAGLAVLVGVVALLPLLPVAPFADVSAVGPPRFIASGAAQALRPGSVALLYPYPSVEFSRAQTWQASAGLPFRMPGGYFLVPAADGRIAFSPGPVGYLRATAPATVLTELNAGAPPPRTAALRAVVRRQLERWHVATILEFPQYETHPGQSHSYLTWLFGPPTALVDGAVVWSHAPWG